MLVTQSLWPERVPRRLKDSDMVSILLNDDGDELS